MSVSSQNARAHKDTVNSSYFKSCPDKWNFVDFLKYRHPRDSSRRKIVDSWTKSLSDIASCKDRCHTGEASRRANVLLQRYKDKNSVDKKYGKMWLSAKKPTEPSAPSISPTPSTLNYAPVFHNGGSALFQNGLSAPVFNHTDSAPITVNSDGPRDRDRSPSLPLPLSNEEGEEGSTLYERDSSDDDAVHKEEELQQVEASDGEGVNDIASEISTTAALPSHFEAFNIAYENTKGYRWILSSGRDVETVLYNKFYATSGSGFHANLARSFILDLGDDDNKGCKNWFSDNEWAEIKSTILPLPSEGSLALFKSFDRFDGTKSTTEFRHRVETTRYKPEGEVYSREKHYNLWSADLAVQHILGLWEDPDQPLRAPQLEDTLSSSLWTHIIDHPILGLDGIQMVHKESSCRATAIRRNRHRTLPAQRQVAGPKIDGIIRSIEDWSKEFGAMEVAKSFGVGTKSTKLLADTDKLIKTLRDMMFQLHRRVDFDPAVTGTLQVVGIMCAGLQVQFFRMYCRGHISVLVRECKEEVPVDCLGFNGLKKLLIKFAMLKSVIAQTATAVKERHHTPSGAGKGVMSDEDRFKEFMFGRDVENPSGMKLGWAADTPPPN